MLAIRKKKKEVLNIQIQFPVHTSRALKISCYIKGAPHSFIKGVKRLSHASSPYRGKKKKKVFQQTDEP